MSVGKTRSDAQKATLFERRGSLLHQIKKWRKLQAIYMPGVLDINADSSQSEKAESMKLWLPSQVEDPDERASLCVPGIIGSERELRFGQLQDSLDDLRRARRVRHGLILFHKVQLAGEGQKTQTKARAAMQTLQDRIDKSVRRYRVARNALLQLDPGYDWQNLYLPLTEADNRGPGKELEEVCASDGHYSQSWIWRSSTTVVSQDEVNKDMQLEWAQCMARAARWEEEVILLQEEMGRVVQFLEWKSRDWFSRGDARAGTVASAVCVGILAYAKKQGYIFLNLAVRFSQRWHSTLAYLSLPRTWAAEFLNGHGAQLTNSDFKKRKQCAQISHPSGVPAVPFHANPMTSTFAAVVPPPSDTEVIDDKTSATSDSEDSPESDSGSDSSNSWVE